MENLQKTDVSQSSGEQNNAQPDPIFDAYRSDVANVVAFFSYKGKQVGGSIGSGFFLKEAGYKGPEQCELATSNHVITPEGKGLDLQKLEITMDNGDRYEGHVIGRDPAHDLAFIKLDGVKDPEATCKSLPLMDRDPNMGETYTRISRNRWESDFRKGKYLGESTREKMELPTLEGEDTKRRMLEFDAFVSTGHSYSGAPFINDKGEIAALHEGGQAEFRSVATPASDIAIELKKVHEQQGK